MAEKTGPAFDQPKRPRNAAATREAILRSALAAFSRYGYDGIGVMTKTEADVEPGDPLLLRSAPNPRAAEILRDSIARHFERPLRSLLPGPKAGERAALILALIAGFQLMRKIIGSKALADANGASLSGER
jgi:hypothetical protein